MVTARLAFLIPGQVREALKRLAALPKRDRFDKARDTAQIRWRADELLALLRE